MALVNSLRNQIDQPVWEWQRYAPAVSAAGSSAGASVNSTIHASFGRYVYYLIGSTSFYEYDTVSDTYLQLSSPPIAILTWSSLRFCGSQSLEGNALAGSSTTITIPAFYNGAMKSYDIKIIAGTGAGQRRTITSVADPIAQDVGVATTVSNTLGAISITDITKAWTLNQWAGYQVRIIAGSGVGQVRKILYNSATVLTLGDSAIAPNEVYCNPMIFSPAISATAGSQSVYQIESSVATVDVAWATTPDTTSRYRVEGGSLFLLSSASAAPFYTLQQYDRLSDTWYIRTATTLNFDAAGTDGTCYPVDENANVWEKGTSSTTGTATTLTDSTKFWTTNQWAGYYVRFYGGTGEGQQSLIASNTATQLTFASVSNAPTSTTDYIIEGYDAGTASSGSTSTLVDSSKSWAVNRWKNHQVKITFGTGKGQVATILSNTSTTLTFNKAVGTAIDSTSVYTIQGDVDKMYIMLGGRTPALIHNMPDDFATNGRLIDSGIALNASVQFGSNRPIGISTFANVSTTCTITTATTHNLKVGQSVVIKGASDSNFNGTFTIATVPSSTTFTYTASSAPSSTSIANSQSTTTLSDSTKSWSTNQWAGYILYMSGAMTASTGAATGVAIQIASNTSTTLTFSASTLPTNGITKYVISPRDMIGNMFSGLATGSQSTVLLTDTNVSSFSGTASISGNTMTVTNVSAGYLGIGSVIAGGATASGTTIIGFGANTNGGVGTYTVSIGGQSIASGTLTSTGWSTNWFAGRRLKLISGTGQSQEVAITSNTANTLTYATITTAPVTLVTSYCVLQQPARGLGIEMLWAFGNSDTTIKGKRFYIARGGAAFGFDYFDTTTDKFEMGSIAPQIETLTTGSMYAYDMQDRIYFTKEVTQRMYYLDLGSHALYGAGLYPYLAGSAILGNRMEIYKTADGLKYLWINRHSNLECYRCLLFF